MELRTPPGLANFEVTDDGCWLWHGTWRSGGWRRSAGGARRYGTISYKGKNRVAHRYMYEATVGPVPDGMVLDHLCGNTRCIFPRHLEVVTVNENSRRAAARPRLVICPGALFPCGHPREGGNLRPKSSGRRGFDCRKCGNAATRRWQATRRRGGGVWRN